MLQLVPFEQQSVTWSHRFPPFSAEFSEPLARQKNWEAEQCGVDHRGSMVCLGDRMCGKSSVLRAITPGFFCHVGSHTFQEKSFWAASGSLSFGSDAWRLHE